MYTFARNERGRGPVEAQPRSVISLRFLFSLEKGCVEPKLYEWVEDSSDRERFANSSSGASLRSPSMHRMLILSGHGSGAVGDFLTDNHSKNGQHWLVDYPGTSKGPRERRKTMAARPTYREPDAKSINVLGMDSCLMSMAEVCYQVRDSVAYLVGSEGFVQDAGWPYGFLIGKSARQLQNTIAKTFPPRIDVRNAS